jgi:hypothetical protein
MKNVIIRDNNLSHQKEGNKLRMVKVHSKYQWVFNLDEEQTKLMFPNRVTMPISKPQTIYTTPIMTIQANIFIGWPPPIPINYKR